MKITFLLPTVDYSGGIRVIALYARFLSEQGHQVTFISRAAKVPSLKNRIKSLLKGKGWVKHRKIPPSHLDGLNIEHRIVRKCDEGNPNNIPPADVIISTWWETAEWSSRLPENLGVRVYFIQHHELFDFVPRSRCQATYRLPFHKIVVADWLAKVMAQQYDDANVDLVPNAVDHSLFQADVRGKQSQATVGLLYHEAPFKGTGIALTAIELLSKHFPDLKVVAFGSKPPTGVYRLPDCVELHVAPPQEDLCKLYSRCDVWLTTSRSEGFNLMAMEAMACRTPVVSSRTGWPVEGIQDGVNGYLVEIDDAAAAAVAVARVLNLEDRAWQVMSANAFGTVAEVSWEASCKKFEQALFRACDRAKAGEVTGISRIVEL